MENSGKKQRFIKIDEVIAVTTLSETQIYRKMKAGEFPKSISIGANSKVWLEGFNAGIIMKFRSMYA